MAHVTITGDPKRLERLLNYVKGPEFPDDTATVIGAAALKLVQDGFNKSTDPYGERWRPLASRRGKPLQKTGRLYRSAATQKLGMGGVEIGLTADYAIFHQDGTAAHHRESRVVRQNAKGRFVKNSAKTAYLARAREHENTGIPQRRMVPDAHGLPEKWDQVFDKAINALLKRKEEDA